MWSSVQTVNMEEQGAQGNYNPCPQLYATSWVEDLLLKEV